MLLLLLLSWIVIKLSLVFRVVACIPAIRLSSSPSESKPANRVEARFVQTAEIRESPSTDAVDRQAASQRVASPAELSSKAENAKEQLAETFKVIRRCLFIEVAFRSLQILINFFQVIAVALSLNVNWTSSIIHLLSSVGQRHSERGTRKLKLLLCIDFLGGAATETMTLPFDCLLPPDASIPRSVIKMIISMSIPVLVATFFAVFWTIAFYKFAKTWQYLAKKLLLSYLVVAYISYESVTKTAVNILVCVTADVSCGGEVGTSVDYWAVDTSVECYEGAHSVLVGTLGWPVVLLFSLGFPVGLAFALVSVRRYAPERDVWYNEATGFLYRAYGDRFFFWESMIMLRKSLLAVIVAYGYTLGPNMQCVLALGVLTAALYLHTLLRPFNKAFDQLNAYEGASLFVAQLTFISGLVLNDSRVTYESQILLSIVLFLAIGGLSCFLLSRIFKSLAKYSRIVLEIEGIDSIESWGSIHAVWEFFSLSIAERFFD